MVRALGLHPARLADPKWNPNHIGAFDSHGRRGLGGLARTLAARAVVGAVHDPQTMNGEAAGMVPKAKAPERRRSSLDKKSKLRSKPSELYLFNL
jgi:hypothetical protein